MKKILIFLLSAIFFTTALLGLSGCSLLTNLGLFNGGSNAKDSQENEDAVVVTNNTELNLALQNVTEESEIVLQTGEYKRFTVKKMDYPVTLIAKENVKINGLTIADGVKDFTIDGAIFNLIGVTLGAVENVTIKNCEFSFAAQIGGMSGLVKNLTLEGCKFVNVRDNLTSAIKILKYDGLTVKNCDFESVEYNALQVGVDGATGIVKIEGNTFKDIGSRVLYLVSVENLTSCEIVGNKFYDNSDSLLLDGERDDGIKKEDGVYIHSKSKTGKLDIMQNYWETIPVDSTLFIASVANYDASEQLLING